MRTTVTLDPDVAAKIEAERKRTGKTFKEVLNGGLRRGLRQSPENEKRKPFKVKARRMHPRPGIDFSNVWKLIEQIEGPGYK
jgi:hypothetical protein